MSNMGRPVNNKYNVPRSTWANWPNSARAAFAAVHDSVRPSNLSKILPPSYPLPSRGGMITLRYALAYATAERMARRRRA